MAKSKAGLGVCPICGEGVVWKKADSGSLSFTCQHCDFRAYAPSFSDANKTIVKGFGCEGPPAPEPKETAKPEPKAVPVATPPAPKPAPKAKPAGIWDHLTKQEAVWNSSSRIVSTARMI